ncbi:uncharacterized protein LOC144908861 isoform X4 [Branchiostoma floridae x Branchiostoma belcheri]
MASATVASGDDRPRVLVTGATGFIASHIVQQLLESGQYTVRGTVRDLTQKNKIAHLKAMVNAPPEPEPEPEPIKDEKIEEKKDEEKKEEEKKEEEKEKKDEPEEKKEEKIEDAAEGEKKDEPAADATTEEKKEESAEAKTEEKTEEAPAEGGEEKKEGDADVKADETKTEGDGKTDDEKAAEKKEEEQKETKAEDTGPTTWEYGDLQLHKADLLDADCWRGLIEGCTYVIHTASPFPLTNPRNEDDVIKPAVEGTTNVLKAVAANGEIKRVILTSSLAAICGNLYIKPAAPEANKVYTEEDWTNTDRAQAYLKSKALAEKAAWDYMKDLKEGEKFELVVLNPGYVMGPVISKNSFTSMEAVVRLLQRSMPAVPKINLNIIDVRDVAKAHIIALTNEQAADNRHILVQGNMWLREVAQILAKEFKPQGYNVPTMSCPKFLLRISSWFDGGLRMVVPYVGKVLTCDNKRMKDVLGIEERPLNETILDMAYSLVDGGFVKKTSKYKGHPKNRPEEPKEEKKADGAVKENGEVATPTPAIDTEAKPDATEEPKADGEAKVNGDVPTQEGDADTKEAAEEEAKEEVTEEKKADGDVKENGEVQGKEEAPAAEDGPKEETAEAKEEKPEEEAAKPESTSQPEAEAAAPSTEASEQPTEEKKEDEGSAAAAAAPEEEKKE